MHIIDHNIKIEKIVKTTFFIVVQWHSGVKLLMEQQLEDSKTRQHIDLYFGQTPMIYWLNLPNHNTIPFLLLNYSTVQYIYIQQKNISIYGKYSK